MKKINIFLLLLGVAVSASAQDAVLYSRGKKIVLHEDTTKFVALSKKDDLKTFKAPAGVKVEKSLSSDCADMLVCQKHSSVTSGALKKAMSPLLPKTDIIPTYKGQNGTQLTPSGYLYVKLKSNEDAEVLRQTAKDFGCEIISNDKRMPLWYTLYYPVGTGTNPVEVARKMYETGKFASCQPEFANGTSDISYDPDVHKQWGLYNSANPQFDINVSEAWNYATGAGVQVAVLDNGIDKNHIDLKDNISSLSYDSATYWDESRLYGEGEERSHGTMCAGVIGAVRNNNIMFAGVAPDCEIVAVSADIKNGMHPQWVVSDGLNWASEMGIPVINCSWSFYEPEDCDHGCFDYLMDAVDMSLDLGRNGKGTVIVTSSGNNGGAVGFPGNYRKEVITVGNLAPGGYVYYMSNYGKEVDIVAPGEQTWTTTIDNGVGLVGGTSMSTAFVSGVIALMFERNPDLTVNQVREILAQSTTKVSDTNRPKDTMNEFGMWNPYYGYGLVNAAEAVKLTPKK